MASPKVTEYLSEQKKSPNKELAADWTQIEEYYNEKYVFYKKSYQKVYYLLV